MRTVTLGVVVLLAIGAMATVGLGDSGSAAAGDALAQQTPTDETPTDAGEADGEESLATVPEAAVENGSLNLTALYESHSDELQSAGYRVTENVTVETNGTLAHTLNKSETATPENRSLTVTNTTRLGQTTTVEVWSTDDERLARMERDDNVTYRRLPAQPAFPAGEGGQPGQNGTATGERPGPMPQQGAGPTGPEQAVPGRVLVALENATGEFVVADDPLPEADTEAGTVTLTAPIQAESMQFAASGTVTIVVDDRGVVRAVNATVDAAEQAVTMTYDLRVEETGVASLEAPDWLSDARDEATTPGPGPGMGPGPGTGPERGPVTDRGPGGGPGPAGP